MSNGMLTTNEIKDALDQRVETIAGVLPSDKPAHSARHAKQAMLYFTRKPELRKCTQQSLIQCVVDSAELGIPLNGRLGHAVAYGNTATFMPDWKGLVSVARRTGQILDIVADVVCENDQFQCGREGNRSMLNHAPGLNGRGRTIGAYAVVTLPGDSPANPRWRYEYMTLEQLDHIRDKSRAKNNGPWVTDTDQMYCKTVIKRLLKSYCDDPTLSAALDFDDAEYKTDDAQGPFNAAANPKRVSYQPLALPAEVASGEPEEIIDAEPVPKQPTKREAPAQAKAGGNPYTAEFADCKTLDEVLERHALLMSGPDAETDSAQIEAAAQARRAQIGGKP